LTSIIENSQGLQHQFNPGKNQTLKMSSQKIGGRSVLSSQSAKAPILSQLGKNLLNELNRDPTQDLEKNKNYFNHVTSYINVVNIISHTSKNYLN
jgi:hypothetical protein